MDKRKTPAAERVPPTPDERCGTSRGYSAHRYRGEHACDPCKAAQAERRRAYVAAHPDRVKESKKREAVKNADRYRANAKRWRLENPDKDRANRKKYYEKHRERLIADRLAIYYADKEAWRARARECYAKYDTVRQAKRRRRAMKLAAATEPYSTQDILDAHGTDCYLCLEPIDLDAPRKVGVEGWEGGLHLDHAIPLSRGGADTVENVRPAHGLCDLLKGSKTPEEFWAI